MTRICPSCGWTHGSETIECEECGHAGRRRPVAVVAEARDAWAFAFGDLGGLALVLTVTLVLAMAALR